MYGDLINYARTEVEQPIKFKSELCPPIDHDAFGLVGGLIGSVQPDRPGKFGPNDQ